MGNKEGKNTKIKGDEEKNAHGLSKADYSFLTSQTGYERHEIKDIYQKFMHNNPDGKLDKQEFVRLYSKLRPERPELLDEISIFIFRAFDDDNNGYITFNEFMIGYALTTRGDPKKKLEYAFELYDADNSGYLDKNEVRSVIIGMLDLLGRNRQVVNASKIAEECFRELDTSGDGKISKDEFIEGLSKNYSLRSYMSPFN